MTRLRQAELAIEAALTHGENDARMLDARDYDPTVWDEARTALSILVQRRWFQLNDHVWGLSYSWLSFCFGNDFGAIFWMQLPFVYFEINKEFIELGLGRGKWLLSLTARWRWE